VPHAADELELREVWRELRDFHGDDLTAELIRDGVSFAVRRKESKENSSRKRAELDAEASARKARTYPHAAVVARKQPADPEIERGFTEQIKRAETEIEALKARIRGFTGELHAYRAGLWDKRFSGASLFWEAGQALSDEAGCSWVSEPDPETGGILLRYLPPRSDEEGTS
jgi:hypothetical protein